MKKIILSILVLFAVQLTAQKKNAIPEELLSCWSRSLEEEKEGTKEAIFRKCDHQFPPRMFRPSVKLEANGKCQILHVGATDIHSWEQGTWTYNKKKKRVVVTNKDKLVEFKFTVKENAAGKMTVNWEL